MSAATSLTPIALDHYALIRISGPDAFKFLQGQVTCDIEALAIPDNAIDDAIDSGAAKAGALSLSSLGGHCTHKGRMLFSFRACALDSQTLGLRVHGSLLDSAIAALKKYSVFSKVTIENTGDSFTIVGISPEAKANLDAFGKLPTEANQALHHNGNVIIALGHEGEKDVEKKDEEKGQEKRYECWLPAEGEYAKGLSSTAELKAIEYWHSMDIQDGLGEVREQTVESFIPQMLNYQVVGNGISFKKGCYTGQEVVARMEYLGKLKKRMHRFSADVDTLITAGAPVYSPGNNSPVGEVVYSAKANNTQELLAVVTTQALEADSLYLDEKFQHKLHALALPYAITKE